MGTPTAAHRLVASRYNIFVPLRKGRVLAYNALRAGLSIWDPEDRQTFERLRGEVPGGGDAAAFLKGGYLVSEQVDELGVLEHQYSAHRFGPDAMILTIAPTLACNFGCDYCFQGADKPNDSMDPAVQDAILAMVERAAPGIKHLHVAWYGGEPLMRRAIIESLSDRFMAFCDARRIRYDAMMVTNGFMLSGEVARSLYSRRVKNIQVTLDGMPSYHDKRRVLLSGKGTFERIARNLKEAADVPIGYSIRVNIDARNAEDVHGLIDHMTALGLGNRQNLKLYFAPVEAITEGCHAISEDTMGKSEYAQLEAELYRRGHAAGLTALPYPPRFKGTCGAVRPKGFVIVPNGDVHKCWDTVSTPSERVGTVFDLDGLATSDLARRWLAWTPFDNESCRNCRIMPICSGACAYKFVHSESTRGEAAVLPCPSWKYNIKEQLVLRAERMGAITAEDYDPEEIRTDPAELCADVHVEGKELPLPMQRLYAAQGLLRKKKEAPQPAL